VGEEKIPLWLPPLIKGNAAPVKSDYGIPPDARVKYSLVQRANRDEASELSRIAFSAQIAYDLKTYVMAGGGQGLNAAQLDMASNATIGTAIYITGVDRVADFWHLVETEDPTTRIKSREYLYYVVWAIPQSTWTALVRKFVNDVIGKIPDREVQTNIARAYGAIEAEANRENQMTDAEFLQRLRLQEQAAKDAQAREMARISQQTAATAATAETLQAQARAEASARRAAYRSGDPAVAAAASVTAADFDWISALAAAADVVF
jgi:hypothetical protein